MITSEKEKHKLYQERWVQMLLDKLISDNIVELKPTFDPTYGFRYPNVEKIVEGSASDAVKFLETLSQAGILKKKLYDKLVECPSCQSPNVTVRYVCPHCNSFNITRKALIEHIPCGGIDTKEHFTTEGRLICPHCHMELHKLGEDYRQIGTWFECADCKGRFDEPTLIQFCRNCSNQFTSRDVTLRDAYSYILTKEAKQEAEHRIFMLTPLRKFLVELGYTVEAPGSVVGTSGTIHTFSIVASKTRNIASKGAVVIDVITSDVIIKEHPVIAMFAKIVDIGTSQPIIVASPGMNDQGKQLASTYKITVVEAKDSTEAIEKLKIII